MYDVNYYPSTIRYEPVYPDYYIDTERNYERNEEDDYEGPRYLENADEPDLDFNYYEYMDYDRNIHVPRRYMYLESHLPSPQKPSPTENARVMKEQMDNLAH